jgi:hypothetical protein
VDGGSVMEVHPEYRLNSAGFFLAAPKTR